MKYVCKICGKTYDESYEGWRCQCGHSLWLASEVNFHREDIRAYDFSMWRYDKAYPVHREDVVATFGEGMTPFVPVRWNGSTVYFKNESLMPTGSFKDRGVVMMINFIKRQGINKITEDSSGNAGAAVSAYSARAGLECNVFVPESTSQGKVAQIACFGAHLHKIPGRRDNAAEAAQSVSDGVYAGHNWHPIFVEGVKSIAYEIWEQNGFEAPDNIVCPTGNGSIAVGLFIGFSELLRSGEVTHLPKIYGVQPENCNTIVRKFNGQPTDYEPKATIAEGIALYFSSKRDRDEVADMIHKTSGGMVSVTEDEILKALREVTKTGYFIEPTSAATFAGLTKLQDNGTLKADEKTAVIISGNGLKATEKIFHYLELV